MDFFSQTYNALKGPASTPQTALEAIQRLSGRLSPSTLLADRRAAVLSLKGLSRDCKADVGEHALHGLLDVLENDSEIDADIGKAVIETLMILCDAGDASPNAEGRILALKNTDEVLKTEKPVQKLFVLLGGSSAYVKYSSLQLLALLLHNRRQPVQAYFLKAQFAPGNVLATLDDKREIIRNEGLILIQSLISQSPDIQKLFAFEGAFDKLFGIIQSEGGVEGGVNVQDCLNCVDGLLRMNVSNQTYFRETGLAGFLTAQLLFPSNIHPDEPAPQDFALQYWTSQKISNVRFIIGILGLLVGSKASNEAESALFTRCLVEMAIASGAPTSLKTYALQLLPTNITFPFISQIVTPYVPVPETNGDEWDKLEPMVSLDALIELVVLGEYQGIGQEEGTKQKIKEALLLRTAGATVFENYTRKEDLRVIILKAMLPPDDPDAPRPSPALLKCLTAPPTSPLNPSVVLSTHLASLLFASLIRSSPVCKQLAQKIKPVSITSSTQQSQFFVPADSKSPGAEPPVPETEGSGEDEDEPQTLIALLAEHLQLSLLSRTRSVSTETERETREWDRLIVIYLSLLIQWLWENPSAVREFLENGGIGMLVEPINQTSDVDPLVQGLCAYLLGVCYEYNRDPGEITRKTIHAIISRLSVDALIGRMMCVRDDERFRAVGPEDMILPYRFPALHATSSTGQDSHDDLEVEIWFDWAFVDFWKSNYYTIQRAIGLDPETLSPSSSENAETAMLIASLREVAKKQAAEIEKLQAQLSSGAPNKTEIADLQTKLSSLSLSESTKQAEIDSLKNELTSLKSELDSLKQKSQESEKEQEDLLVFLEELSTKRKRDKQRMKEAGLNVSEDEGGDDDEDDGDEDEDEDD